MQFNRKGSCWKYKRRTSRDVDLLRHMISVAFGCLLRNLCELHMLCELLSFALILFLAILSDCCDTVAWAEWKLKKWPCLTSKSAWLRRELLSALTNNNVMQFLETELQLLPRAITRAVAAATVAVVGKASARTKSGRSAELTKRI